MSNPQITATISAEDKASAVLRAVAKLADSVAKDIEKTGKTNAFDKLPANFNVATVAAERHAAALTRIKDAFSGIATAAAAYAAIKLPQLAKGAFSEGEHLQHEQNQLANAGIRPEELERAKRQVVELTKQFPNITVAGGLETYKELRSVLKDIHEVPHLLPTVLKAKSVLDSMDPTGGMSHGLGFLVKGAEVSGIAQDPERFRQYLDAGVKAMQVMGKTINPEQMFEIMKYEKASASQLSGRFQTTTALSVAQEMGGSTTGQSIDQFIKQIIGGFQGNLHSAAKEFVALGLANKSDFELNKAGDVKGLKPGRKVAGADLAQTDPDKWVHDYLKPALEAHGFKDEQSQVAQIRRMFPAGRAADLVSKLVTQSESFANHAKLYEGALGLNADTTRDAATQIDALTKSIKDLGAAASEPIMGDVAKTLNGVSTWLRGIGSEYTQWAKDHPGGATAATIGGGAAAIGIGAGGVALTGAMLKSLLGGAALDGSAVALTGAAASLEAAAVSLGGKGMLSKVPGAVPPAVLPAAGATIGMGTILGGFTLVGGMVATIAANASDAVKKALTEAQAAVDRLKLTLPDKFEMANPGSRLPDGTLPIPGKGPFVPEMPVEMIDNERKVVAASQAEIARLTAQIEKLRADKPAAPGERDHVLPDAANARPQKVEVKSDVAVQGDVKGEAEIISKIDVQVIGLDRAMGQALQRVKVNLTGKLGQTMAGSNAAVGSGGHQGFQPTMSGY